MLTYQIHPSHPSMSILHSNLHYHHTPCLTWHQKSFFLHPPCHTPTIPLCSSKKTSEKKLLVLAPCIPSRGPIFLEARSKSPGVQHVLPLASIPHCNLPQSFSLHRSATLCVLLTPRQSLQDLADQVTRRCSAQSLSFVNSYSKSLEPNFSKHILRLTMPTVTEPVGLHRRSITVQGASIVLLTSTLYPEADYILIHITQRPPRKLTQENQTCHSTTPHCLHRLMAPGQFHSQPRALTHVCHLLGASLHALNPSLCRNHHPPECFQSCTFLCRANHTTCYNLPSSALSQDSSFTSPQSGL
jgi:hypothetical protein